MRPSYNSHKESLAYRNRLAGVLKLPPPNYPLVNGFYCTGTRGPNAGSGMIALEVPTASNTS